MSVRGSILLLLALAVPGQLLAADPPSPRQGEGRGEGGRTAPAITVATQKSDGTKLAGKVAKWDADGFDLLDSAGKPQRVAWRELKPLDAFGLFNQLLSGIGTGKQWLAAAEALLTLDGGEPWAETACAMAVRLDPTLKGKARFTHEGAMSKKGEQEPADRPSSPESVALRTGFDSAGHAKVRRLSATDFTVDLPEQEGFWAFELRNVAGKTVKIELVCGRSHRWDALNPVFLYLGEAARSSSSPASQPAERTVDDALAETANYDLPSGGPSAAPQPVRAPNGSYLPDTSKMKWRFMLDCVADRDDRSLVIRHAFPKDAGQRVVVAMRYPYTSHLCDAFMVRCQRETERMKAAGRTAEWEAVKVGKSAAGRPLWLVRVGGSPAATGPEAPPCVLIYGREHGNEPDGSWVVQGALDFLTSNCPEAATLRRKFVFLLLPLLDPDGAARCTYDEQTRAFQDDNKTVESEAWATFFQEWVNAGNRLDLAINLHNVESTAGPNIFPPWIDLDATRRSYAEPLLKAILEEMSRAGFASASKPKPSCGPLRLGGWLDDYYGTLHQTFEINAQARERHLALGELRAMGGTLVQGIADYYSLPESRAMCRQVTAELAARNARRARYEPFFKDRTVFDRELWWAVMPSFENGWRERNATYPDDYQLLDREPLPPTHKNAR